MSTPEAGHRPGAVGLGRRQFPVGAVVAVYVVVGTLWIFGGGPVADAFARFTSVSREAVESGKDMAFVVLTALVLRVMLRRWSARLDAAATRMRQRTRELELSESRSRLQATALEATANAVVITGVDGTIRWVNTAFETMTGYPASEAVGATPQLLKSGVQDEQFYRDLWETVLAGRVWRGQVTNRRRDGALYTISQTITPVLDDNGQVQHFVALHEDITERLRAAHDLEASRVRLQALFDHALDAIVLADDERQYIEVNPAFCVLTGYSRDELLGMGPSDLAAPDRQPTDVTTQFDAFVRVGSESGAFPLRHKDGQVVETEYRAVSDIQPGVHLSILRDVTTRNRTLRALTLAESQFHDLAESAADIVAQLHVEDDGGLQVDYVNPAVTTVLGYPQQRFHDDPDLVLGLLGVRSDDPTAVTDLLPTPDQPTRLDTVEVRHADGRLVWLEVHSVLTDPSTVPVTVQFVARDVTARTRTALALEQALIDQQQAADRLRAVDAMKDTFLQSVSHELRTPLTAILGFAELLTDSRDGLSPANTRDFHSRIRSNAERLRRLLDDLLDVDRFSRGSIALKRVPTGLTELVERVVEDVDLDDHPIELDLEPVTMDLDAPMVERIVANLLRNVVRHTPAHTRMWVAVRPTADGVRLTVDDDGPGIPETDRQRVVEPFEQGAHTVRAAQPGTGVGLSLVATFAQLHGGDLTLAESPAGGARVTVTLGHAEPATPEPSTADAAPGAH